MHLIIWEFEAREGAEAEFEQRYGSHGAWAQLFRRAPGFIRSELNRDLTVERTYVVFDYWQSQEAYEAFKTNFAEDYRALDEQCEELTERELHVGTFHVVTPRVAAGQ